MCRGNANLSGLEHSQEKGTSQFSTGTSPSCHSAPLVALCILLNQHVHGVPFEGGEMGNKQKHLAYGPYQWLDKMILVGLFNSRYPLIL